MRQISSSSGWPPARPAPMPRPSEPSTGSSTATSTPSSTSRPSSSMRSGARTTSSRALPRSSRSAPPRSPAHEGLMADWATWSSLATAGGTLVLAVATFASVRSGNRSARIAEQALQEQRRPLFVQSHQEDPEQRIMFGDSHWVTVEGSRGMAEYVDGVVYLVMSLRNAGAGIGVCQAWCVRAGPHRTATDHFPDDEYRAQMRDLYIPGG